MKKFFVLLAIIIIGLFIVNIAKAQNTGWWLGGKVGYLHGKADNRNNTDHFSIAPEFGYDSNANWSLDASLSYDSLSGY